MADLVIRTDAGPQDYPRCVEIWRSAVEATHDFLAEADRTEIGSQLASTYLPAVQLTVAELDGVPVGFAGTAEDKLEMLFVHDDHRNQRVGSALLDHVLSHGVTDVDVNEQNSQALGFYLVNGFEVIGRSETDDQGRDYPILQLRLRGSWGPSFG